MTTRDVDYDPYDSDSNRTVRQRMRDTIARELPKIDRILTLPGEFCHDLDETFLPLGLRGDQITLVERVASRAEKIHARVAADARLSGAEVVEGELEAYLETTERRFDVVNFDFDGYCTADRLRCVELLVMRGLLAPHAIVFVRFLGGREDARGRDLVVQGMAMRRLLERVHTAPDGPAAAAIVEHEQTSILAMAGEIPLAITRPIGVGMHLLLALTRPRDAHQLVEERRQSSALVQRFDGAPQDVLEAVVQAWELLRSALWPRWYVVGYECVEYAGWRKQAPPMLAYTVVLDQFAALCNRFAPIAQECLEAILEHRDPPLTAVEGFRRDYLPRIAEATEAERRFLLTARSVFIRPESSPPVDAP